MLYLKNEEIKNDSADNLHSTTRRGIGYQGMNRQMFYSSTHLYLVNIEAQYDAIIGDVCYNNENRPNICPTDLFLNDDVILLYKKLLKPTGFSVFHRYLSKFYRSLGT